MPWTDGSVKLPVARQWIGSGQDPFPLLIPALALEGLAFQIWISITQRIPAARNARSAGQVKQLRVAVGDPVRRGQVQLTFTPIVAVSRCTRLLISRSWVSDRSTSLESPSL